MKILKDFIQDRHGVLLQVMIGLVIMGVLSYTFWSSWESCMTNVGTSIKTKIESDSWLAN